MALTHTPRRRAFAWGCGAGLSGSAFVLGSFFNIITSRTENRDSALPQFLYLSIKQYFQRHRLSIEDLSILFRVF
jgi:hypothetical protein